MSKFHSTLTRRDFMKALGLAGAGLGAAAATAPVFHDLDEVLASPMGNWKRPWWIKERAFNDPTPDVDWGMLKRYDKDQFKTGNWKEFEAQTATLAMDLYGTTDTSELHKTWAQGGMPGMTLREQAVSKAIKAVQNGRKDDYKGITPEALGVPKWSGTPEENTRMMLVANRFFGSVAIGVMELDSTNVNIVWGKSKNRDYVFEDVPETYTTDTKYVIPTSQRFVLNNSIRHPSDALRTSPGYINNPYGYFFATNASVRNREFIKGLGYHWTSCSAGSSSIPAMTGVGEQGRGATLVMPQHGYIPRRNDHTFTDLPLAPTKPIDFGLNRFCHTCKKCATHCPTGSIPEDTEPVWEGHGPWNNPGVKSWFLNYPTCGYWKSKYGPGYCGICLAVCPFSTKMDTAIVHGVVGATVATTSLFNGFISNMDDFFGYGNNWRAHGKDDDYVEQWWNTVGPELGMLTFEGW